MPQADQPLRDWQAVVVGGGVINGITQSHQWPDEFIATLLKGDQKLAARWRRAIDLSAVMADNVKVRNGTRYDALRMIGIDSWEKRGEQLQKYLAKGVNDELQMGAVSALGDMCAAQVGPALVAGLSHFSKRNRELALDALLRDDSRIAAMLDAVESGQVSKEQLGEARIATLRKVADLKLRERVAKLLSE